MINKINYLFSVILLLITIICDAQTLSSYPQNYFRSPIDSSLSLSGNFGEIRPNHFHAGLDIKTGGVEGKNIYAVADGYVSRIKISPKGYGKVMYITHPNGYVSVYAHLQRFTGIIGKYIIDAQYAKESFEIELFPKTNELPVKAGELIAISGNTGGSMAPHLHFEIRDEKTEQAFNPLLFSFNVKDDVKPIIKGLYIYHFNDTVYQESICDKNTLPTKIELIGNNGVYKLKKEEILDILDNTGFGIEVYDQQSGSSNLNGIYSIELKVSNVRIYYQEMEQIAFDESRYINSHIDYYEQKTKSRNIQKSFIAHNNQLKIYKELKNMGIINFNDLAAHKVEYIVKDIAGNTSVLIFNARKDTRKDKTKYPVTCVAVFNCKESNQFKNNNVLIDFPENTFYEDLKFDYSMSKDIPKGSYSPVHRIHNRYVPVHSYYTLSIKTADIPDLLKPKATIVSMDEKGWKYNEGGEWKDGFVVTKTRTFGNFTVVLDTVKPFIKPVNIAPGKNMSSTQYIQIKISDNLSGIKNYRASIDGKWILMEYEPKQSLLFYMFDKGISTGKHFFNLEVKDNKENTAVYNAEFVR